MPRINFDMIKGACRRATRVLTSAKVGKFGSDGFPIDAWSDDRFPDWRKSHFAAASELEEQQSWSPPHQPVFSVVVPLYKTPLNYLSDMADSVLSQTYRHIELVLVNASPESIELREAVEAYAKADSRVTVVQLDENKGITENTNEGIAACAGDFVSFLDHDDYLEPNLFYEYAKALNADDTIDLLYCDEELVFNDKSPAHPLLKPDFSPELLLSKNYIVHLMTVRKSILDQIPRPTATFDGAQDYNMVLQVTKIARNVHHVPKILYHWRISAASTAIDPGAKPYQKQATRLSLANHLNRAGHSETRLISSGLMNLYNMWLEPTGNPKVSVCVNANAEADSTIRFLEFFAQNNSYGSIEFLIACGEGNATYDSKLDARLVKCNTENPFSRFNACAEHATGDYLLFLDSSCAFGSAEPVEQLVGLCQLEGVGVVAPKVLYADMTNRCYGVAVTSERIMPLYRGYPDDFPGYQCNVRAFQNVSATSYLGMMTARSLFKQAGGFDAVYEGEIGTADYCHRVAELSLRAVQTPTVKLVTLGAFPDNRYSNGSDSPEFTEQDLRRFDKKWPGIRSAGDPYYNRNFDQSSSFCQLP